MRVFIPSPLYSYTGGRHEVEAKGATLAELFTDLDARHAGLRFRIIDEQERIRPHIRVFVNGRSAPDLAQPLDPDDEVHVVAALSGG